MNTLTIGFPAKFQIHARFATSLLEAMDGLKAKSGYKIKVKYLLGKSNLSHARSIMVTEWYDQAKQGDLFMFIDTDHTFLDDDIIRVINQDGDLKAGIYANRASAPTSIPDNGPILLAENAPLAFAATGFLCFTYNACKTIHAYMKQRENLDRVIISDNIPTEDNCIPFFHPIITELNTNGKPYWLGEDFSFSLRAKRAGLKIVGATIHTLGHEMPFIVHNDKPLRKPIKWEQKSIVYYCGNSRVRFGPNDTKLGGSEQAVVFLSKELAKHGYKVTVYGNVHPIVQDGVTYSRHEEFVIKDKFDTIILWRRFGLEALGPLEFANAVYVDLHDPTDPKALPVELIQNKVKKIFVKSKYHRSLYPHIDDSKFTIIANGLQIEKIKSLQPIQRNNNRFCYTSCYERGLVNILRYMWPQIKLGIPDAEFHIYYGSDLISEKTKQELEPLFKQSGVYEHGRGTHEELLIERQRCLAQLYFTSCPLEIDCLSIREAAAVGCIPILSTKAVFPERAAIHIEGDPGSKEILELAAANVVKLHRLNESTTLAYRTALIESALKQSWAETAKLWIEKMG
jgi:hypothetical protein